MRKSELEKLRAHEDYYKLYLETASIGACVFAYSMLMLDNTKIHLLYASITILVLGWLFFRKTFHEKKGSSKYIHTKKNVDMVRDLSSILSFNYALTVFACYLTLSIQNQEKTFSEKHYIIFGSVLLVFLIKAALIYLNTLENDND